MTGKNINQRFCVLLFLLLAVTACAYRPRIVIECVPEQSLSIITKGPVNISAGEKLNYVASWNGIPSGRLILEIKGIERIDNRNYYHIVANASPNDFFSIFFNVKYFVETFVDKDTGLPLKFYKKKSSGKKITEETIIFNQENKTATWEYTGQTKKIVKLNKDSHDLLSFLYYYRLKGLEPNKAYDFDIAYNGLVWPVKMDVGNIRLLKLRNKVRVNTFYVKLVSELITNIMGSQTLEAYVSVDAKRIPIFFTAKTKMGQTDTALLNYDSQK